MRHHVFSVPDADERLQALIEAADDRNDLIRTVREINFRLPATHSTLVSRVSRRFDSESCAHSLCSSMCSKSRRRLSCSISGDSE